MIGMIQILTYLLAVYLIFKGFEILQIALMSNRTDRTAGIVIGTLAIVLAIGAAVYFVDMADTQAKSVASSSQR
jgi:hypothetical protein